MAETKQEKQTFKWGDSEYLLDDLLKLHAEQEQNFYNFAKAKGSYDDAALTGLRSALTNRINAAKSGKAFSADGLLDTDTADNTSIQTQKKGLFKKEKYVEQDNTEWAKYYLNKLVGQLKPYKREDTISSKDWDISKHGFEAYLKGQGLDARDIFENYDLRDENNPDAARSYTQRDEQLRKHLGNYKTWLENKGFDFTKNDNEWDDNYMATLDSVINGDWTDRTALAASLRKLGSGNYAVAFTSDRWDLSKSDEELTEESKRKAVEKKEKEEKDKYAAFAKEAYANYRNLSDNNLGGIYFTSKGDGFFDMSDSEYEDWLNTHTNDPDAYMNQLQAKYYANPFDKTVAGEYLPLAGRFGALKEVNIDGKTWYYDPRTIDRKNNRLVIFDKETGEMKHTFLGDVTEEWNAIRKKWRQDNGYEDVADKYTSYNEHGGVLSMQTGGGFNLAQAVNRDIESRNKARAAETGVTEEVQKARDRYINSDNKSIDNPDAGLTTGQKARIGYAIADITSAVSAFFPGAGTVVSAATGLGSTFGNFISDWSDDAVTAGQMWRNLGMNLGMDVLGLVPGGGAASKMSKVVKSLKTVVPVVVALPGVASMLANTPEIAQSWKKVFDGDPAKGGSKVTYQDYMNILQVLNVAAGGTNIARNVTKTRKMNKPASDKIAIDVTDKAGNRKALVLEGEDVKAFQTANKEGKAQEFINNIEGGSEFTINTVSKSNHGKFWGTGNDGKWHLFNEMPFAKTATGSASVLPVKTETMTTTWGKPVLDANGKPVTRDYVRVKGMATPDLMDTDLVNLSGRPTKAQYIERKQGQVDQYISRLRAQAEKHKMDIDTRLRPAHERVKTRLDETTAKKAKLEEDLQTQQAAIDQANADLANIAAWRSKRGKAKSKQVIRDSESKIEALEQEKADILQGRSVARKKSDREAVEAIDKAIEVEQIKIEEARASITNNSKDAETSLNQRVTDASTKQSQLQVELTKLQDLLERLTTGERVLRNRTITHSDAYNKLANFKSVKRTWNDIELEFKPKEGSFDLDKLYKEGGTINRNKINKFLSYAKR